MSEHSDLSDESLDEIIDAFAGWGKEPSNELIEYLAKAKGLYTWTVKEAFDEKLMEVSKCD